jgi:hypothetical protein
MSNREYVKTQIDVLPEDVIEKVVEFISFQKFNLGISDITLASEYSLAKDWMLPEEDAAWEGL